MEKSKCFVFSDPNKSEDSDEQVHGFIGNQLHPIFGGKLSLSEQFQNLRWTQIQNYLRQAMIPIIFVMSVSWSVME